jgi:PAS domain S-box-containing protein
MGESLQDAIVHGAVDALHVVDGQGRLVEASDSFLELMGFSRERIADLVVTDWDVTGSVSLVQLRMMGGGGVYETRFRRGDGSILDVEVSCRPVRAGQAELLVQTARDVTERRRQMVERLHAEAEQRALAARLRMMLETAAEGVVGIDDEGRIMFANRAAADMMEFGEPRGIVGKPAFDLLGHRLNDGSNCDEDRCSIHRTLRDSQTRRISDECFVSIGGRVFPVEYVVSPLVVEGVTIGAVVVFHDVSDRKALEADLRRSNAELEQFAYVASHDLRQPLRMVSSYLSLIASRIGDRLGPDERQFLAYAVDGAKRMDGLILGLLEYSRVGRDSSRAQVNLNRVLDEVRQNLMFALDGATLAVAPDLPTVEGDGLELMRLFQNLVGNALKYRHPDRAPVVEVGWRDEEDEWIAWVADNGIGIAPEDHDRAFGIFQRLVASDQYEGTGIGLAICRKIVEHHNGRIWIESAVDQGTRMLIAFPKGRRAAAGD